MLKINKIKLKDNQVAYSAIKVKIWYSVAFSSMPKYVVLLYKGFQKITQLYLEMIEVVHKK